MADALKKLYSRAVVNGIASAVAEVDTSFNLHSFMDGVFDRTWNRRELKDRMHHISRCLYEGMSGDYPTKIKRLMKISPRFDGLPYMIFPDIVEIYGLNHWDISMEALQHFTPVASAEFAVRPFIIKDSKRMMAVMNKWARHPNEHVRRLASEGCRPRLPWAMALPEFKRDPALILPILEQLKNDPSEYVRRSVANNINDISKDHPDLVLKLIHRWLKEYPATRPLVKHACRTLLKKGDQQAMKLFGYDQKTDVRIVDLKIECQRIPIGGALNFSFTLKTPASAGAHLRIEYAIEFMKSNGRHGRKVFKITERNFRGHELIARKHRVHDMTTRVHHPGVHHLHVLINGVALSSTTFELVR